MVLKSNVKAVLKKIMPKPVVSAIQYVMHYINDVVDSIAGRRDPLIPPTRYMFDGTQTIEDFKKNGEEFFKYYTGLCGLNPDGKVLDVGSGIGRKTLPLTKYLSEKGGYEGFDIVKFGTDWCSAKITPKHPNFRFQLADVYNEYYNPTGKFEPSKYRFPYEDNTFDLVTLGSVFTHMLPRDVENYLKEVARVMKKGGKSLISYFILNDESLKLVEAGKSTQDFRYKFEGYRTTNPNIPEDSISFPEEYLRALYCRNNLSIIDPIKFGSWCGRTGYLSYQDLIIAEK